MREKELAEIYKKRLRDFREARTRRKKNSTERPTHFKQALNNYFGDNPEARRKIDESSALASWDRVVGPTVARVSKALRFQGNTLVVGVTDPLWLQQLLFLKQELIHIYQREFPSLKLRDIYMRREDIARETE